MIEFIEKIKRIHSKKQCENSYEYTKARKYSHGFEVKEQESFVENNKETTLAQRRQDIIIAVEGKKAEPKAEKSKENIYDELNRGKAAIGYLYSLTSFILEYDEDNCPLSSSSIVKKWDNSLSVGKYNILLSKYNVLKEKLAKANIVEDFTKEKNCIILLKNWLRFLEKLGIITLKEYDENKNIVVTTENRQYYDNGSDFPDGAICRVTREPLIYKNKLYYGGSLEKIITDETKDDG